MRFLYSAAILACLLLVVTAAPARAAETAASEVVVIPAGDTVPDDLYAVGNRVVVEGTINGDLVAFAAEEIVVRGEVTGSVTAIAPRVLVEGEAAGSVRFSSRTVTVSGSVGEDLVGAAIDVELGPDSTVEGDVLIWAFRLTASGDIGNNLEGSQRTLELEGSVQGDVDVSVGRLSVTGPLEVGGDLGYRSDTEATGLDQAEVGGVVAHKTPLPPNIRIRALGILTRFFVVLGLTTAAVLVAWGWPRRTGLAGEKARTHTWRALGLGALVVLSPLLVAGIAALIAGLSPASASLPLLAVFVPLILALGGIVLVLSLVVGVPAVLALGRAMPGERGLHGSILLGSVVAGAAWLVPWVGWLVPLLVLPIGLGAWILSFREGQESPLSPETA
jgi:hypothetical protein